MTHVIQEKDSVITLTNSLGCKLMIYYEEGKYGLGTFYMHDTKLGGTDTTFIHSDNHYVWEQYKATRYEITENTPQRGTIEFSGTVGAVPTGGCNADFQIKVTLSEKSTAYHIEYEVSPKRVISPDYPLYVSVPFFNSNMQFVQYPYRSPVRRPFTGSWTILPDLGKVPFMFGCERFRREDKEYFVGVGYHMEKQDYTKGRFEYDTRDPEMPFKVYFPYQKWYYGHGPYKLHIVISTAKTQSGCIRSYMEESGFDVSTPIRRKVADSISALMRAYKTAPLHTVYVPGKGYRGHAWANSDEVANFAYTHVWVGVSAQLGYQFYKYWEEHPEERWAKERAIEMADFFVASQIENGAVPLVWKVEENQYGTTHDDMERLGYIYSPWMVSIGSHNLYRLYLERKRFEGVDCREWKESAISAIDWIAERIEADGLLGHTYNSEGEYSHIGSQTPWALIALDYFYQETGDGRYDRARAKLEEWTYETFAGVNEWYSGTDDDCSWRPVPCDAIAKAQKGPQVKNHDAVDVFTFAAYCAKRYMVTGRDKYLQWAKDVAWYGWLTRMPVQIAGYEHPTKGLVAEQYFWQEYSVPWCICTNRCFPYLSLITEDPFYAKYYKMLIQTMMAYQCYSAKYPFFLTHLRHHHDREGPGDEILHMRAGKKAPWTIIFTSFFLEDMTAPYTYSYIGGKDWGVGLDYDLAFTPDFGENPYVMAASTMLTSAGWDIQEKSLFAELEGKVGRSGTLRVKWYSAQYPLSGVRIEVNDEMIENVSECFDSNTQTLNIGYTHQEPAVKIKIRSE